MARLLVFDWVVFISAIVFCGYLLGLQRFMAKQGDNGCEMTYMYEYPQFVKVSLPPNVSQEYQRYGLFAYSEGRQTQQTRNMQFSGIPVLFIPGQGGSLKQVRSLASVSLRKSLGSDLPYHFDFFTLDLNEEYSAMFGGVLMDQTRFAVHAVQRIISLYKRVRPDSIVIIGHSMGGMIAKGLFLEPDFPSSSVRLVVTLATPHSPVILTDPLLRDYYDRVSPHWATNGGNVTVVSLGGGVKDLVVRSGLTLTDHADISVLTTAVSEVWMSVDHLCILWCKQLVLVVVRALFDSVDIHTKQISRDPHLRLSVFKYHLLERSAGKRYHESSHPPETTLQTSRTEWLELTRPRYTSAYPSLHQPTHLLIHLPPAGPDTLAVTVTGQKARDWLFACPHVTVVNDNRRVCTAVENLSSLGRIAPSKQKKHKVALVNLRDLRARGLPYIVIRLAPTDEFTSVSYDMFTSTERTLSVTLPRWLLPLQWTTLLPLSAPDAVFYTLDLPQLERPWQAFSLNVRVDSCRNMTHQAVTTLRVPWSHQHSTTVLRNSMEASLPIVLHTARPTDWNGPAPYVTLYLDPKCQYSLQIESSMAETLAQLVRLYSSQLIAYVAAILLLTIRHQLLTLGSQQHCQLFHHALLEGAKPYYILPAVKITSNILSLQWLPGWLHPLLPTPDLSLLTVSGLDFVMLPLFLYSVAFSITFLLGLLVYAGVVCSGSTINKFVLKFVGKLTGVGRTWSDWLMAAIDKVPCVVSAAMVAIMLSSCGGLAMLIGAIYYFMRVCGMYEDYIEQLFFAPVKYLKDTALARWRGQPLPEVNDIIREAEDLLSLKNLKEFNFHLTVMMLWGTSAMVHLPSVLVWAHNFKYSPVLDPDPATVSALVSSVSVAVIWTLDTPVCGHAGEVYKSVASMMFVLACLVLTYCPISLYNLPTLIAAALVCLSLHQLYEWVCLRYGGGGDQALESTTDTSLTAAMLSDQDSEGELSSTKRSLEDLVDSDEGSSPADSDKSERVTPTRSDIPSRKNSRTSDFSMSSYEAVSLTDMKVSDAMKGIYKDDKELQDDEDEDYDDDDEDDKDHLDEYEEEGDDDDEEEEQPEDEEPAKYDAEDISDNEIKEPNNKLKEDIKETQVLPEQKVTEETNLSLKEQKGIIKKTDKEERDLAKNDDASPKHQLKLKIQRKRDMEEDSE